MQNLDLKKEQGFKDKYFEKKINYLLGYVSEVDETISEKNIKAASETGGKSQ